MLNTCYHTILLTFRNSSEQIIFNTTDDDYKNVIEYFKKNNHLKIDKIKEFKRSKFAFRKASLGWLIALINYNTELNELIKKAL